MRVLIGAAAALLFVATAAAQTGSTTPATPTPLAPSTCGEVPAAPTQPDPAHATSAQMTRANQAFEAWSTDAHAKLQCRQAEVRALAAQAQAAEAAYNTQAAAFTSTVSSWNVATQAYNNRGANSGTADRRHSTLTQHGPN